MLSLFLVYPGREDDTEGENSGQLGGLIQWGNSRRKTNIEPNEKVVI